MKNLFYTLVTASILLVAGCGDSFYSANDYLTSPVNGVGLKSSTSLVTGGTEQLYAIVSPPKAEDKSVIWTSNDSSIVSVDGSGLIKGVAAVAHDEPASAVITVTTVEGGYSAQCKVTVREKPIAVTGITISRSTMTLPVGGEQEKLTAEVIPSVATNQNMVWRSSDSRIVTVEADGTVTAVKGGKATVTVTSMDGGYKASCFVTSTTDPVYSVTYDRNGATGDAPVDKSTYLNGETVIVMNSNTLYKTGYTFAGWETSSNGIETTYAVGSPLIMGTSGVTLYAVWNPIPRRITYDGNGNTSGTVPVDDSTYKYLDPAAVPGNTGGLRHIHSVADNSESFKFGGWNTKADGTGDTHQGGDSIPMGTADITLYAKWVPFVPGDIGPAGGIIFYDKGIFSRGDPNFSIKPDEIYYWRYLEAAPVAYEVSGMNWSSGSPTVDIDTVWYYKGRGYENTEKIMSNSGRIYYAAKYCANFNLNGYYDWYLPTRHDLGEMYQCRAYTYMTADKYWTSELNGTSVRWYGANWPEDDCFGLADYDNPYRVRPVRRF